MFKMMDEYSTQLEAQVQARMEDLENEKKKKELLISRMLPPWAFDYLITNQEQRVFDYFHFQSCCRSP